MARRRSTRRMAQAQLFAFVPRHLAKWLRRDIYEQYGAGNTLSTASGTATNDDIEIANRFRGIVLRNSNGTRYRLGVDNLGVLAVTPL